MELDPKLKVTVENVSHILSSILIPYFKYNNGKKNVIFLHFLIYGIYVG